MQKPHRDSAHHLYIVRVRSGEQTRNKIYSSLREDGIGVNLHYIPIYKHPFFQMKIYLENAEYHYTHSITLPIYPAIDNESLHKITDNILRF